MKEITLIRKSFTNNGVFGELVLEKHTFFTLERSYLNKSNKIFTKVKDGVYTCKKGIHRLKAEGPDFETFEIKGVKGHWGILFHVGNYNEDSDGCVLIGLGMGSRMNGDKMITSSKQAFKKFMDLLAEDQEVKLIVRSVK